MFRVMAVDDEYMILRGLPKLIDWAKLDMTITSTYQNPKEALAALEQAPVDILLSDMNMPELSGPEFLAAARQLAPNMQIIVLSGYGDFDYLKAGIEQGVINYLRKPIDPAELETALATAVSRLRHAQNESQNAQLARQALVREAVAGQDPDSVLQALASLGVTVAQPMRLLAFLNPHHLVELTDWLNRERAIIGYFREGQDVIALMEDAPLRLRQLLDAVPTAVGPARRPVIVSPVVQGVAAFGPMYQRLRWAINRRYFFAVANGLVMLPEAADADGQVVALPGLEAVKQALRQLSALELAGWLQAQFDALEQQDASVELTRQVAVIMLLGLRALHPDFELTAAFFTRLNAAHTVEELVAVLIDAALVMAQAETKRYSRTVAAVIRLIEAHYQEPLTLAELADTLHMSAVYLGQQFKKETGQSVAQYLNDYRINLAIAMLENSADDVSEIADKVGYQTASYFFKMFKKQLNMSPGEYREMLVAR